MSSMQPSGNYNNLVVTKAVYTPPINTNFMQAFMQPVETNHLVIVWWVYWSVREHPFSPNDKHLTDGD